MKAWLFVALLWTQTLPLIVPPLTQVTDPAGDVWTIGAGQAILRNGTQAGNGLGSKIILYAGAVYTLGIDGLWYKWGGTSWSPITTEPWTLPPPQPAGIPSVQTPASNSYRLDLFPTGTVLPTDSQPVASIFLPQITVTCDQDMPLGADPAIPKPIVSPLRLAIDDPARTGRACTTNDLAPDLRSAMAMLPAGTYPWAVRTESDQAPPASYPFLQKAADPATDCAPPPGRLNVLSITVGNYSNSVRPGASGQVAIQVISKSPVVQLRALLNNAEVGKVTGPDVGRTAGLYFTAPTTPGSYSLIVDARDALGCTYRSGLSRPVKVQ